MAAIWNRINTLLLVLVVLMLGGVIAMFASGVRGGPLDPTSGPAPTDSVRLPGIPISQPSSASGFPIPITQPGKYYLTSNIIGVAGKDGITIAADNVTIDLMGFMLDGPSAQKGITDLSVGRMNVTIRNGTVRNWSIGIELTKSGRTNLDDLRLTENTFVAVNTGSGGILSRLVVRDNIVGGVDIFQHASGGGTELKDSIISHNNPSGAIGVYIEASNVWVHDNVINSNSSDGIMLCGASRNKITDNQIFSNGRYGVNILNCDTTASGNLVARNAIVGNATAPLQDTGVNSRIGVLVGGDAAITGTNPWSNVAY